MIFVVVAFVTKKFRYETSNKEIKITCQWFTTHLYETKYSRMDWVNFVEDNP